MQVLLHEWQAAAPAFNAALQKAMVQPEVTSRLKTLGVDPIVSTPQEFGTFIRAELDKYKQVIRQADIKEYDGVIAHKHNRKPAKAA